MNYWHNYFDCPITEDELSTLHDDLLDELYPTVTIGIFQWAPSRVLKVMEPVGYRVSLIEYVDQLIEDGQISEDQ